MGTNKQLTLLGEPIVEEEKELEFVKVHEEVAAEGDQFTMKPTSAVYNQDKECLTLIDSEKNQGLTVYANNIEGFTGKPNLVRLGQAMVEFNGASIGTWEELADYFDEGVGSPTVEITWPSQKSGRVWKII